MLTKVTYNEDLANFARVNSKFVALVEKTFAEYVVFPTVGYYAHVSSAF